MNAYQSLSAIGAQNTLGGSGDAMCEQRQPEVAAAFDRMSRLLEALGGISLTMSDRLTYVLRPEAAENKPQGNSLRTSGTPMADRLNSMCDQLEGSMNTLAGILHRIEI